MAAEKILTNDKGDIFYQASGVVKSYNEETGYGFIFSINEPDYDIYVHFSNIIMEGKKSLKVGDNVEFLYRETKNGLRAYQVKKIS